MIQTVAIWITINENTQDRLSFIQFIQNLSTKYSNISSVREGLSMDCILFTFTLLTGRFHHPHKQCIL